MCTGGKYPKFLYKTSRHYKGAEHRPSPDLASAHGTTTIQHTYTMPRDKQKDDAGPSYQECFSAVELSGYHDSP